MKLTTKLVLLITSGFITVLLIDSYFLIEREREVIEQDRLQSQIDYIESVLPVLNNGISIKNFSVLNTEELKAFQQKQAAFSQKKVNYWFDKTPSTSAIIFYDINTQKLYKYTHKSTYRTSFSEIYKRTAAIIFITVALAFFITYLVGRLIISRPVNKILNKIEKIKSKDYGEHLELNGKDEFSVIAHSLNDLASEIDLAYQKLENENKEKLEYIKQLRHVDRLNTIGVLASGIAHELGTPLNVILGHCSLIKNYTAGNEEKLNQSLSSIHNQVNKMSTLIKNLLTFSQKSSLNKSRHSIAEVINSCIEFLSHQLKKKDISVNIDISDTAYIYCDLQKIEQVFLNLFLNAIYVLNNNGVIKVSCKHKVEKKFKLKSAEYYMVSFSDNGPGIALEDQGKVFDPFFTTKDVGEGTGLGLSISLGIIEEHDGWIEIDSSPGEGAFFYIYLPVYSEEL